MVKIPLVVALIADVLLVLLVPVALAQSIHIAEMECVMVPKIVTLALIADVHLVILVPTALVQVVVTAT